MTSIPFPEKNCDLGRPPGMTAEECNSLPVWRDGKQCISCWQPDDAERAAIAAGAPIWLYVIGGATQPPVALTTISPFLPPEAR